MEPVNEEEEEDEDGEMMNEETSNVINTGA